MFKLQVGKKYYVRNGGVATIDREVEPNEIGYDKGFRFQGSVRATQNPYFFTTYTMMFKEDGTQFGDSEKIISTPYDIVSEYKQKPEMVLPIEAKMGAHAGEIHGGYVHSGLFKGWEVTNRFDIPEEFYDAVVWDLSKDPKFPITKQDAQAYIISVTDGGLDLTGYVSSALVVYRYETMFYIASLFLPEEFLKDSQH